MNGHVFECFDEQRDRRQYSKTLDALQEYAKKHTKFSEDLSPLFATDMRNPVIEPPADLPSEPAPTRVQEMIWMEHIKEHVKRSQMLRSNLATVYAVIWGQCSETMRAKLKSHDEYSERSEANDCYWILKQIKAITLQFDERTNGFISLLNARTSFLNCRQGQTQSADAYMEALKGWADTIEYCGGTVAENFTLVPATAPDGTTRTQAQRTTMARDQTLAIAFIRGVDPTRYGTLVTDLSNQYAMGIDNYPSDLTSAYGLVVNYKTPTNERARHVPTTTAPQHEGSAMTFAQLGPIAGSNGVLHEGITCYNCQAIGHYASDCPHPTTTGTTLVQYGYMLAQAPGASLNPNWILLDTQSTVSVFNNPTFLTNIRPSEHVLRAFTNGGHQDSQMIGDFANLGPVWFNEDSIANILSMSAVRKVCRITMDTSIEPAMLVHRRDGTIMRFKEMESGLYVYDSNGSSARVIDYTFVSTVAKNKSMFTRRQVLDADRARELYRTIGRPSEAAFQDILTRNLIHNCPVTAADAHRALIIYGPDVAVLKGKMTRTVTAPHVPTFAAMALPPTILEHHQKVTLCMDFFFVQGLPFFHSISRHIGFRTIAQVPNRLKTTILRETQAIVNLYHARGFTVSDIHTDNELACIREDIRPIHMDVVPVDSHVGEVERSIRTIKERVRATAHGLPFKRLPRLLVQGIVTHAVQTLNQFPWMQGVSDTLSPANIVTGQPAPDYNTLRIEFGTYAQVYEDPHPSNTVRSRSLGAIALTPTGNAHGDVYFLSLATGERISRHQWTVVPMSDAAIARVEALAHHEGQPLLQQSGLVVEWRPDQAIDDDVYDADFVPPDDVDVPLDDDFFVPILDDELAHLAEPDPAEYVPDVPAVHDGDQGAPDDEIEPDNIENQGAQGAPVPYDVDDEVPNDDDGQEAENEVFADDHDEESFEGNFEEGNEGHDNEDDDEATPVVETVEEENGGPAQNLRPRGGPRRATFADAIDEPHNSKSYDPPRQFVQHDRATGSMNMKDKKNFIFAHVMTQMTAKAGIKKHGKEAEVALMQEFAQLEELSVFEAVKPDSITKTQKREALRAINLIKEKRDGRIKGRTVADGRPQRSLYDKSETASPTVSTEALLLSIIVDAHEGRDVATADVAGAYLKAEMDDFVLMKFTGQSVDIMCEMNAKYTEFVVVEGETKVLYVRLLKALYGCVKSALLWYDLFTNTLQGMGFVLNPYDKCVANCMIDGKQCTIAWYVDDTKISHISHKVVTEIILKIEEKFGKMTVTRGKEHVFLGMNIRYTKEGTAVVQMRDYLVEALEESEMEITRATSTPAKKNLFDVDEKSPVLGKREAEIFHSVVAKLLYVSIRARMDMLLAVAFLCTRVSKSTREDQGKLRRLLEYIKGTLDLEYTLGADDLARLRSWVDAAYAVHPDMKSHTGGVMSFGTGGFFCKSSKQKLNTKSSTEAELVGASDYLPNTMWVKMFMEAQGFSINENFFEQDNESAIKLEKNGRASAGQKSRHINIRFFFIKDRTKDLGIEIRHCPTLQMLADFFTKPLQGALFRKFRDVLLGYRHVDTLTIDHLPPIEERVGKGRSDDCGTVDPGTEKSIDVSKKETPGSSRQVTWAEVVCEKPLVRPG